MKAKHESHVAPIITTITSQVHIKKMTDVNLRCGAYKTYTSQLMKYIWFAY